MSGAAASLLAVVGGGTAAGAVAGGSIGYATFRNDKKIKLSSLLLFKKKE